MKTIELPQEFLDKIVLDELTAYREVLVSNMVDYYLPENTEAYLREDMSRHIMVIAAIDIIIGEFTE
jgi:hypothetical protein